MPVSMCLSWAEALRTGCPYSPASKLPKLDRTTLAGRLCSTPAPATAGRQKPGAAADNSTHPVSLLPASSDVELEEDHVAVLHQVVLACPTAGHAQVELHASSPHAPSGKLQSCNSVTGMRTACSGTPARHTHD